MGDPGGLPSMGSHRVGDDWNDLAAVALYLHEFHISVTEVIWKLNVTISSIVSSVIQGKYKTIIDLPVTLFLYTWNIISYNFYLWFIIFK